MRSIFLWIVPLFLVWSAQGYTLDDRDSAISYYGPNWVTFSSGDYYAGTTTDNACTTAQNCGFRFTFTGSGFSIYRWPIQNYDIPLRATVTVDGRSVGTIERSTRNQDYLIYTLSSLTYGSHNAQIDFLSYDGGVTSHLRLDKIEIDETRPPTTTSTTTTTSQPPTPPAVPIISSSPIQGPSVTPISTVGTGVKKAPAGAIAGGVVGGLVAVFLIVAFLLYCARQKKRAIDAESQAPLAEADPSSRGTMPLTPEPLTYSGYPQQSYQPNPPQPSFLPAAAVVTSRNTNNEMRAISSVTQDSSWSQFSDASLSGPALVAASAVPRSPSGSPPAESSRTPAPSTIGSFSQTLSEDQVDFVAELQRQGIPAAEVARIVERMLSERGSVAAGVGEGSSTGVKVQVDPPDYDFKTKS